MHTFCANYLWMTLCGFITPSQSKVSPSYLDLAFESNHSGVSKTFNNFEIEFKSLLPSQITEQGALRHTALKKGAAKRYLAHASQAFPPTLHKPGGINRWCQGETGEPLVGAGIPELKSTGYLQLAST